MLNIKRNFMPLMLIAAAFFSVSSVGNAVAATAEDLNKDAGQALQALYKTNSVALDMSKHAKAVLVFPNIVKAGLVFGGSYGEGVLLKNSKVTDYYNSVTASWGLQAGAQSYGYAVFLMTDKAVKYLADSHGWELDVGPTVFVVAEGVAKNLSSSTINSDAYALILDQQDLMLGLSVEGSKITHIKR